MELLRKQAEELAEARRESRAQALEWSRDIKNESDEEKERKTKKVRRVKVEGGSGDEVEQPKKKRRGKLRKNATESGDDKEALFTDDEGGDEKPAKKVCSVFLCQSNRGSSL
jgi:RNA polymerase-associated protein CTR9